MSVSRLATDRSREAYERAREFLPMGVTGDGRWSSPYPIVFAQGHGKWLRDVDGNSYLDYHGGFGSTILGYAHPEVDAAVAKALEERGLFVGLSHPHEAQLAERLCQLIPGAEKVALSGGGGSDAIYNAVRLARGATDRTKLIKVEGGYHGWHSDVGVSTRPVLTDPSYVGIPDPVPNSPGILPAVSSEVVVLSVNDEEALEAAFERHAGEIAAMIIEPVLYSAGCVLVEPTYLRAVRDRCTANDAVLIFDEVMSGFRNGLGGAGARLGVVPDLAAYGKAIANGYIISVLAGRRDLMSRLAPEGPVLYSGTFNGHPLSVAAAEATLDILERDAVAEHLWDLGDRLAAGVNSHIAELELNACCQTYGSVWNLYFHSTSVRNYRDLAVTMGPETEALSDDYRRFLRERGIYIHKRHVNRGFISAQHDEEDIDRTIAAVAEFLDGHRAELSFSSRGAKEQ